MIDLKKATRKKNDMYESPIGRVFHVSFPDYLDSGTRMTKLKLVAHVGNVSEYAVILQSECNYVMFKAEIICMHTIILHNAFNIESFKESKLPKDEIFRIGEIIYFEPNSEDEYKELTDDEIAGCM